MVPCSSVIMTMYTRNFLVSLINFIIGIVVLFLVLRLVLRLFGASSAAPFVAWVYAMSGSLLEPFRGIFPNVSIQPGFVLEFPTLFAILAYSFFGWLLISIIDLGYRSTLRYYDKYDKDPRPRV